MTPKILKALSIKYMRPVKEIEAIIRAPFDRLITNYNQSNETISVPGLGTFVHNSVRNAKKEDHVYKPRLKTVSKRKVNKELPPSDREDPSAIS